MENLIKNYYEDAYFKIGYDDTLNFQIAAKFSRIFSSLIYGLAPEDRFWLTLLHLVKEDKVIFVLLPTDTKDCLPYLGGEKVHNIEVKIISETEDIFESLLSLAHNGLIAYSDYINRADWTPRLSLVPQDIRKRVATNLKSLLDPPFVYLADMVFSHSEDLNGILSREREDSQLR